MEWPIQENLYGIPETNFTLPLPNEGQGLYLPDIQSTYPEVDWQNLDRLYLQAGHYNFIRIGNLPERTQQNPLIITNINGQVRVGGLGHYYLMILGGGSNWVLTGRYDPTSQTGDIDYPGHRGGQFANSQDTYGIMIDDDFVATSVSGVAVSNATHYEIEFIEIKEVEFAGMILKTDDDGTATMDHVRIHDNYIHDVGSEGLYIGSTQAQPQHQIRDWEIYNNRILRTGTEAIQLGQLGGHNKVFNNVFGPAAIDWRASFQNYQDNNFQITIREGQLDVYNNIFIGAAGSLISLFSHDIEGDATDDNVGINFSDNYFSATRNLGMYLNTTALENFSFQFDNNVFTNYRFDRNEVYSSATEYGYLLRIMNNSSPVTLENNTWYGPESFINGIDNNGIVGNKTATNNTNEQANPITFVNSGLAQGFDYLDMEMWTDIATRGDDEPVDYYENDIVLHHGIAYQCNTTICTNGIEPQNDSIMWIQLPPLADDVRVQPNSEWDHLGIQPVIHQ